jgi:hypothetical protein
MNDTTPIEKKSLEAHVDLCAERYKLMSHQIISVNSKVDQLEMLIKEVHDMVAAMTQRRNDQLISWGAGIIATLIGVVGWLLITYVIGT